MNDLIESYYAVARDLERQSRYLLDTSRRMAQYADQLCEEEMKRKDAEGKFAAHPTEETK